MPDSDIIFSNSSDNYKSLPLVFKKGMFACQDSFTWWTFVCEVNFILPVSVI